MRKKPRTRPRRRSSPNAGSRPAGRSDPLSGLWAWTARAGVSIYVVWCVVVPPSGLNPKLLSIWLGPRVWAYRGITRALGAVGVDDPSRFLEVGVYYVLSMLVVPAVACALLRRRRPADTGWRKPNRFLLRIVGSSFVVSIPFLYWMVQSPTFAPYYRSYLAAGPATVLTYYVVALFCEHFFFEGVMLAAFRTGGRWPHPPTLSREESTGWRRVGRWFGVAQPTGSTRGLQRVTRWLGVPDGCLGAMLLSGVLFGLIHWGKSGREFLLAFPGGVFLAALAYRCNSWHAPYLLHAGTVTAAAVMFLLTRP